MKIRHLFVPLLILSSTLPAARAEETCETVQDCFDAGFTSVAGQQATEATREKVEAKSTGVTSDATGLTSTLTNFLTPFSAAIDSGQLSDLGQAIVLDLGSQLISENESFKFQVVVHEPEVFEALKNALPEDTRDERAAELAGQLGEQDDLSYVFNWNIGPSQGRDVDAHRSTLDELFTEALAPALADSQRRFLLRFGDLLRREPALQTLIGTGGDLELSKIEDRELREAVRSEFLEFGQSAARASAAAGERLRETRLDQMFQLINNQPQWILAATLRQREGLTGPDEDTFELTYERGIVNVNSMKKKCDGKASADYLACYTEYLGQKKTAASMKANDRVSFSLEYVDRDDFEETLDDGFTFSLPGSSTWSAELAYGRYLWVDADGEENGRIDVSICGEWNDEDAAPGMEAMAMTMPEDRVLLTATYTHKLTDQVSTTLGFAWADEPEFLPEVEDQLTSRIGLIYRINRNKSDGNGS